MPVYDMVDRSSLHTIAQRGGALRGVVCFFPPVDPQAWLPHLPSFHLLGEGSPARSQKYRRQRRACRYCRTDYSILRQYRR